MMPLNRISRVTSKDNLTGVKSGVMFKITLFVCMSFNTAGITLMVYYTRNKVEGPMYLASTSVVIIEFIKLIIAVIMLGYESKHFSSFILRIYYDLICQPVDMLKVSIPALLYAIQNNLIFVSLSNLDPATYQVTSQFRILTTALVMYFVLKKRLSHQQWFALFLLFLGVVFVNMKPEITQINTKTSWNYFVGLTSLLMCCFCSSFAGVYFEKMLKYSSCSFWVRNIQLYIWGIVATGSNILLKDYEAVSKLGFFYGYTPSVWILIGITSLGGVFASLIIKHLDNNFKSLSAAGSIIVAGIGSYSIFHDELYIQFFGGAICVFMALFLYLTK